MRLLATWASNGPPGARFKLPNRSPEASTRVTAISMVRRTRKRVMFCSACPRPAYASLMNTRRPTGELSASAQIPLPDVPRVAVGGELWLEIGQPVRRRGHVGAEVQRNRRQLVRQQQLQRVHGRFPVAVVRRVASRVDRLVAAL